MSDKGRVIIADDHGLFRQGLRQLLEGEGYEVAAEADERRRGPRRASPPTPAACCCSTSACPG